MVDTKNAEKPVFHVRVDTKTMLPVVYGFSGSPKTPAAAIEFAEKAELGGDKLTARAIRQAVYNSSLTRDDFSPLRS